MGSCVSHDMSISSICSCACGCGEGDGVRINNESVEENEDVDAVDTEREADPFLVFVAVEGSLFANLGFLSVGFFFTSFTFFVFFARTDGAEEDDKDRSAD